jgi:sensor histidine kinase YesM
MNGTSTLFKVFVPAAAWVCVSLTFAAVQGTTELEPSKPPLFLLYSNAIHFGIWTCCVPLIAAIVRRFPLQKGTIVRHAMVLLPCSFLLAYAVSILYLSTVYFTWFPLRSRFPNLELVLRQGVDLFLQMDLLACVLIVSLIHAWTFLNAYRSERLRSAELENKLSSSQLSALRMQLHPHFLFNTLHSIAGLVKESPDTAREMIVALGDFLRLTLEEEAVATRTLGEELEFINLYVAIERMRLGERMQVEYHIGSGTNGAMIPYLILQPLVENAIRHGVSRIARPSTITFRSQRFNGQLHLVLENDGPKMQQDPKPGVGITNTRERLRLHYGESFEFSCLGRPSGGCRVSLTMPFKLE